MPEKQHPTYSGLEIINVETHHEKSDVNVRALLWSVAIFVVFAAVSHFVIWWMYTVFVEIERGNVKAPLTQLQRPGDVNVPQNQPLLQPFPQKDVKNQDVPPYSSTPITDLKAMRAAEDRALTTYGWVDQQKGVVRIPIEQAKQLALQRGFPVQAAPPVTQGAQ